MIEMHNIYPCKKVLLTRYDRHFWGSVNYELWLHITLIASLENRNIEQYLTFFFVLQNSLNQQAFKLRSQQRSKNRDKRSAVI